MTESNGKISVIGPTFPFKGGISHFTTLLVSELRKKKAVQFISWKRQYPAFLYPVEQKDTVSKEHIASEAFFILDFMNPFTWLRAAFSIKKNHSDEVIFTWVTPVQGIVYFPLVLFLKLFTKSTLTFLCHNVLPHEKHFFDYIVLKANFYWGNKFIVHSREDEENLGKLVKGKKIIRAFHPIYSEFNDGTQTKAQATKLEYGLKKNVLLFFGYIRPYKGLPYLIQAMPEIIQSHPDTTLLIVGEFWAHNKQEYTDVVAKLGLQEHVVFIDAYVPNEDVKKYFQVSDVVIAPYTSATQSGVIQIAYAFNKPVIATDVGGLSEAVVVNETGYVIESESSASISNAVRNFLAHPIDSERVFLSSRKFGWDRYIDLIFHN